MEVTVFPVPEMSEIFNELDERVFGRS